jgi:hypothetical protein
MDKGEQFAPLFTYAEDFHNNACINWSHNPLELYATAYKEAAEKLVIEIVRSQQGQDTLVYPIVFLYRQYIELRLKEIILEGRKILDESGNFPMHHRIHDLWPTAMAIIEKVFKNEEGKPDFGFVAHVLSEFSKYDPESFSFRYPTDKEGNNPLFGLKYINVRHLAETIDRLAEILERISAGISEYRGWQNEMDQNY